MAHLYPAGGTAPRTRRRYSHSGFADLGVRHVPTDRSDDHFGNLLAFIPSAHKAAEHNPALLHLMVDGSANAVDRLADLGIAFPGPHPELPHRASRMHNAVPDQCS